MGGSNSGDTTAAMRARPTPCAAPFALAMVLLLAPGCSTSLRQWMHNGFKVGPNYCPPTAPTADQWVDEGNPAVNSAATDYAWWTVFNDPTLNTLIDAAYAQNLDLKAATARILEARARRRIAVGNLFPQSQQAILAYAHGQTPGRTSGLPFGSAINFWADGLNASWELDFWGRLRRNIESADANIDVALEGYGNSLVLLLSEVATNYVQLRTFEQRLIYARENVEIQAKSLELVQVRYEAGTVTELDLRQARASLAQTQATIGPLESGRRLAANQLCVLLGTPVINLSAQFPPAPIPAAPPQVAVGIPAELLMRRPDVRRAERQAAAQSAQIGIAEADLYPRLSIIGFIGYTAQDFNGLFDASNLTAIILPTLQWKILNYGRIANNIDAQTALLENAIYQYQQTALRAGREVEDALVQFIQAQQQAMFLQRSVEESARAVQIAQEQFRGGTADFNRVYTNQAQLVAAQDQLAAVRGSIALYLIQVYKAVGGGWEFFCEGGEIIPPPSAATPFEQLPSIPGQPSADPQTVQ